MTSFTLIPEQLAAIDAICNHPGSVLIETPAGGSKTTILVESTKQMSARLLLALAFNKKNADDLTKRMPSWVTCKTMNGLGHGAWAKVIGRRLTVDTKKIGDLVSARITSHPELKADFENAWEDILRLVNTARNVCAIPPGVPGRTYGHYLDESLWDLIELEADVDHTAFRPHVDAILRESIRLARTGLIDFADQIYMSVCFGGVFSKFPFIMVDEAQDLSPANHEMLRRSLASGGKLVAVGDRFQAIYAFRGADAKSIETMVDLFSMHTVYADTSFRCPIAVCDLARKRHPRITPFSSNPQGKVEFWDKWSMSKIPYSAAILCRNNAPLLDLAFKLLGSGRGVNFMGGDLSKGLMKILRGLGGDETSATAALDALTQWKEQQLAKLDKNDGEKASRIHDKTECIRAVFRSGPALSIGHAKELLLRMFSSESGPITLCSGHKSKGFEWETVIILDPWRIPSKYAKEAEERGDLRQIEQEFNLRYVMQTRAMKNLYHASLDNLE